MTDPELQRRYLSAMGIDVWVRRDTVPANMAAPAGAVGESTVVGEPPVRAVEQPIAPAAVVMPAPAQDVAVMDWDALRQTVSACTRCALHETRTQTVFGVGNPQADWMVVGEAPGADEDRQGEPFVGRAGQLLNAMLLAIGLKREQVYIANILKCRPPNNRDPRPEEVACCEPYLQRQIQLVQPKLILAVGRIAAHNLLKTDTPLGRLRGRVHHYGDPPIPLVITYHPAYLLRSPAEKRKAWEDLQFARKVAGCS